MAKSLAAMSARLGAPTPQATGHQDGDAETPAGPLAWVEQNAAALVLLATLCVLAVGIVYAFELGNDVTYRDDAVTLRLADQLAREGRYSMDGSTPSAVRPPAYPTLLAGLRLFDVPVIALRMVNIVLLALTVPAAAALAGVLAGPLAALAGAALVGAYPLFLYSAGPIQPQTLAALLLITGLLALVRAARASSTRARVLSALAGGLLSGLLILTSPIVAASLVLIVAWMVVRSRASAVRVLAVALPALLVLPGLWTARNAVQFGAFVPVTTSIGYELLRGSGDAGDGSAADISSYETSARARTLGEVETDRYYRASALRWIAEHPGGAVAGYLQKLLSIVAVRDDLATPDRTTNMTTGVVAATYLPLLALFAIRAGLWRRRRPSSLEVLLVALIAGTALLLAVTPAQITTRVPLDVLLCVIVATLAPLLAAAVRDRRGRAGAAFTEDRPTLGDPMPTFELQPSAESLTVVQLAEPPVDRSRLSAGLSPGLSPGLSAGLSAGLSESEAEEKLPVAEARS